MPSTDVLYFPGSRIGKISARLMTVFFKVFGEIVLRVVLMMIRKRAADESFR